MLFFSHLDGSFINLIIQHKFMEQQPRAWYYAGSWKWESSELGPCL